MQTSKLTQNIDVLTRSHIVRHIDSKTGETTYPQEIALFEQLRTEIGSSSRQGGQSGSGSRSPVALGAVVLWAGIQETLNTSYIAITGADAPHLSAEEKLTIWIQAAEDADTITKCVEITTKWVDEIRELLNPEPTLELIGACPACGNTHVYTDQDGETIRNTALVATTRGANCRACDAQWEPSQFEDLKHQIR